MHELSAFIAQCAASGALLASLCALFVVPVLAWLACRALAPWIRLMHKDPAWQAPLAAAAAGLPGLLFLTLAASGLTTGVYSACLSLPAGRTITALIGAGALAAIIRAVYRSQRRFGEVRQLLASSSAPAARLRKIAAAANLAVRQLDDAMPLCMLAGTLRPKILVSAGTLNVLSDDELHAAFMHEAAHARHGDQLFAALVSFFVDLLPLPANDLVDTYRGAREIAADRRALQVTSREDLAGALLELAGGARLIGIAAPALAGAGNVRERIDALLNDAPLARTSWATRIALALAIVGVFSGGVAVPTAANHHPAPCATMNARG